MKVTGTLELTPKSQTVPLDEKSVRLLDWEQLAAAKEGDQTAWQQLTARHQPLLWKWLLYSCLQQDTAREIQQEAWVRMYHVTPRHHAGSFRAYLFRITRNLLLKSLQRDHRLQDRELDLIATTTAEPLNDLLRSDRNRWLTRALAALPDEQRDVLQLRFFGEQTLAEIAVVLAVPTGTVKSRLHYGISSCREYLMRRGVEL